MAVGVETVLSDHIKDGYLSVPYGSLVIGKGLGTSSKIKVVPAAQNNLPDTVAMENAVNIKSIIDSLSPSDIALILISGGGSALLPLPRPQISLSEKLESIKIVANAGGTIQQLNTMRKKLSQLKGGGLLSTCESQNIISLIISDIVGDPLDLIASGPTVHDTSTVYDCLQILEELDVMKKLPVSVVDYLKSSDCNKNDMESEGSRCDNVIVGSNRILVESVVKTALESGYFPYVITRTLEGEAETVGRTLAEIAAALLVSPNSKKDAIITSLRELNDSIDTSLLDECLNSDKVCFICAGETTVLVQGGGRGGRNQHLVLSAMNRLKELALNDGIDFNRMCLLSGGTDGQDGATDVAGALCDGVSIRDAIDLGFDIKGFLDNCGSYDFFAGHTSLDCFVRTGLTGTNVMDVQVLLIDRGSV